MVGVQAAQLRVRRRKQQSMSSAGARAQLAAHVLQEAQHVGMRAACGQLAAALADGSASAELLDAASAAQQRKRGSVPSERTLRRWAECYATGGALALAVRALAPAKTPAAPAPADAAVQRALALYASKDAQWRNLASAAKQAAREAGIPWQTLYSRCRRALQKQGRSAQANVALIKARHSGSEARALLPFTRRDWGQVPLDIWVMDGHSFKAKVRHPVHGAPFTPEVTMVMDAATRKIMGWSVSLSESAVAVGDALRHAISQYGVPAILYTDNGAGETAKTLDCPLDGLLPRLGIEHKTGIPGNPQGRGIIERSWQSHMIECARQFATFQGSDVDDGTRRAAVKVLEKEQRALRRSEPGKTVRLSGICPSWQTFVAAVGKTVADYNASHRHRALPKNEDGEHMTPNEAWQTWLNPADIHPVSAQELASQFMPAEQRIAQRGEIQIFNQTYYAPELMRDDVDGHAVSVHYDIHDASYVQIYMKGEFICTAKWNGNRRAAFPTPVIEMAREKRAAAAIRRRELQIAQARAELQTTLDIPANDAPLLPVPDIEILPALPARESQQLVPLSIPSPPPPCNGGQGERGRGEGAAAIETRPFFQSPAERYEYLMRHQNEWTDADTAWLHEYTSTSAYEDLHDYYAARGLLFEPTARANDYSPLHGETDFEKKGAAAA